MTSTTTKRRRSTRSKAKKPALEQIVPVDLSSLDVVTNNKTPMNGCKMEVLENHGGESICVAVKDAEHPATIHHVYVIPFSRYKEDITLRCHIHKYELALLFKDLSWLSNKSNELMKQGLDMLQKAAP